MSKRICFISGKFGDVDGVSLETDKWASVLTDLGVEVYYCAGEFTTPIANSILIPEISFQDEMAQSILKRSFNCDTDVDQLKQDIEKRSEEIFEKLKMAMEEHEIDIIVPQNILAIPMQLPLSVAVKKMIERISISSVCHNHDFFWERERYANSNIQELLNETFPVDHFSSKHAVINSAAERDLMSRRDIESVVVPNVMDFEERFAHKDEYNDDLRNDLGLAGDEYLFLQPTRVVARKGIETALELVARLSDIKVKLLISGYSGDEGEEYKNFLLKKIDELGLQDKVIWGDELIRYERGMDGQKKLYNLSDAYAVCDFVTYPSTYEGFGNAFLETVLAKKPFLVNNYLPVFEEDIKPHGFDGVIIDNSELTDEAVSKVKKILFDSQLEEEMVNSNFELGKKYFSYEVLEKLLKPLFGV